MDFRDVLYMRRSVRQYEDKQVEQGVIEQLLDAAVQAPSAMNTQPWTFAVIQDADLLKKISDRAKAAMLAIMVGRPEYEKYREHLEDSEFHIFYNAPTLILVIAKPNVSPDPRTDCTMAAYSLMLTARSLGLGTCWIGFAYGYLNTPEGKKEVGIPADYDVVAPLIVGHPAVEMGRMERNAVEVLFWR